MSLFDKFNEKFLKTSAELMDELYKAKEDEDTDEERSEKQSDTEALQRREKVVRKDILKDLEACFILLNYIKRSENLQSLTLDCEQIESLLGNIKEKLEGVGKADDSGLIKELISLLKSLTENSSVEVSDNIQRLLTLVSDDDVFYKFFALHSYFQNQEQSSQDDITLISEFNILYVDFIKFIRQVIKTISNQDNLFNEKVLDEILNYSKNFDSQILSKLQNKESFEQYKNNFKNAHLLSEYIGDLFRLTKQTGSTFEVNREVFIEISMKLQELKNEILRVFKSTSVKDEEDDIEMTKVFYSDLIDAISSKEFFKKYKMTTDSSGDNQAVRQFLLESFYNNFSLGNMSKYCDRNINDILNNLKDYLSEFKLRDSLPEDYESKVKDIVNFGTLSIALSGTDRFINSKGDVFDMLQILDYYTKNSATKFDIRTKIVKPLSSLYKGIIKLITPTVICEDDLETLPDKVVSDTSGNVNYVFKTKEAILFIKNVYEALNKQLDILDELPDVSEADNIVDDSEVINAKTIIIKLYEFFNKEFYNNYKNKFDEYNTYIGNL